MDFLLTHESFDTVTIRIYDTSLQYYLNSKHESQDGDIVHTARQLNVGPITHRDPPPLLVHVHVPKLRLDVALYTEPLWGPDDGCHYPEHARAISLSHGHVI